MTITFQFPYKGELLLEKGQNVDFDTPLYKEHAKEEVVVPLAKMLKTSNNKIFQNLKKFAGEPIMKGDLIAENATFLTKRKYFSEHEGTLKEINHQQGTISIQITTEQEDSVFAFFQGEVAEVEKKEDEGNKIAVVTLKVKHMKEADLKEATEDFGGGAVFCKDPIKAQLTEEDVDGRIVIDNEIPSYEQIKYEALGARGFVSLHSLPEKSTAAFAKLKNISDYEKLLEKPLPFCLTNIKENKIYFYE
jgi:hypothetical protein